MSAVDDAVVALQGLVTAQEQSDAAALAAAQQAATQAQTALAAEQTDDTAKAAQIAQLQAALQTAQQADASDRTQLAAVQAAFAAYKASHPDPTPAVKFVFGVEPAGNDNRYTGSGGTPAAVAWSYQDGVKALGRDMGEALKFFDDGKGIAQAVAMRAGSGSQEPFPLYAVQGYNAADVKAFLDALTYRCRIGLHQEWGRQIAAGTNPDSLTADFKALNDQLDGHKNGHLCEQQLINSEASERTNTGAPYYSRITVPKRADGSNTWIGADTYITTLGNLNNVEKAYASSVAWFNALKAAGRTDVHLAVSETGVSRSAAGFTPALRAQFYSDAKDYLTSVDPGGMMTVWICDDTPEGAAHDYAISKPGDAPVAQKLAALVT